jgi:hypothetical protein
VQGYCCAVLLGTDRSWHPEDVQSWDSAPPDLECRGVCVSPEIEHSAEQALNEGNPLSFWLRDEEYKEKGSFGDFLQKKRREETF